MTNKTPPSASGTTSTATHQSGDSADGVNRGESSGFDSDGDFDGPATRPATTSTVLALTVTLGTVSTVVWYVDGVGLPVALGALGAVSYALSLWLTSTAGRESVTTTITSLLSLVVGGGFLAAIIAGTILAVSSVFPVEERALLSLGTLVVVGHVGVVVGCVLAILGTALGVRNLATSEAVAAHSRTVGLTAAPPAVTALLFLVAVVAVQAGARHPVAVGNQFVASARETLLAPSGSSLHLGTWFLLVTLAASMLRLAIGQLPLTELIDDSKRNQKSVDSVRQILAVVALFSGFLLFVAGVTELLWTPGQLRTMFGQSLYDAVGTVTTLGTIRYVLVSVTAISLFVVVLTWLIRQAARAPQAVIARRVGPIATGILVILGAITNADPIYTWLVSTTATQLPEQMGNMFTGIAENIGDFFGEPSLVVLLVSILGTSTVLAAIVFRLALFLRYISRETAGFSLASGGLFVATVFAATIEAPTWLVLGGVVASLLVWDAGRFGTTLGNEIGHAPRTHRAEFVHASGTVLVGLVGAGLAVGATRVLTYVPATASPTAAVALVFVASGIVFLVAALR